MRLAELTGSQYDWSDPALAAGWLLSKITNVTSSEVLAGRHGPFEMVQRNVLFPIVNPLTVVVGLEAFAIEPLPLERLHVPVAGNIGVFPKS